MTFIRDFIRQRRIARYVKAHGPNFDYLGLNITFPDTIPYSAANALLKKSYEMGEAHLIQSFLAEDKPVIELGGSLGVISRLIRSKLDSTVPHIVVEANTTIINTCRTNACINSEDNTTVHNAAISYDADFVEFPVDGNVHVNRLGNDQPNAKTIRVPTMTLNALWQELDKPEAYTLICDIEGAELDLVTKDAEIIANAGLIIMELHPNFYANGDDDMTYIIEQIEKLGFERLEKIGHVIAWHRAIDR